MGQEDDLVERAVGDKFLDQNIHPCLDALATWVWIILANGAPRQHHLQSLELRPVLMVDDIAKDMDHVRGDALEDAEDI